MGFFDDLLKPFDYFPTKVKDTPEYKYLESHPHSDIFDNLDDYRNAVDAFDFLGKRGIENPPDRAEIQTFLEKYLRNLDEDEQYKFGRMYSNLEAGRIGNSALQASPWGGAGFLMPSELMGKAHPIVEMDSGGCLMSVEFLDSGFGSLFDMVRRRPPNYYVVKNRTWPECTGVIESFGQYTWGTIQEYWDEHKANRR
jgi:hypothetical protein